MTDKKWKNLQRFANVSAAVGSVRDQNSPLSSAKTSEYTHKIEKGIGEDHQRSDNLREMRNNSWWVSSEINQNGQIIQGFVCRFCGKGFKSARAVFGHMRCHKKRKAGAEVENCDANGRLVKRQITPRKKRSGGRYRIKTSCSNNSSWSNMNATSCSSVSVVDDELVDIAASLLMLSEGFCSVDHVHSDNDDDSVKMDARISVVEGYGDVVEPGSNFDGFRSGLSTIRPDNFEYGPVSDVEIQSELYDAEIKDGAGGALSADTLFGYLKPTASDPASKETKFETLVVVDRMINELNFLTCGPLLNHDNIASGPTVHIEHESDMFDAEMKDENGGVFQADTMVDSLSPKSCDLVSGEEKHENIGVSDEAVDKCKSGTSEPKIDKSYNETSQKYICSFCNKSFLSHQALGGHRVHCRRLCRLEIQAHMRSSIKVDITLGEKQGIEDGMRLGDNSNKRSSKYKCLVCFREFLSGQALGGHMRAHINDKNQPTEIENLACDKENLAAVADKRKEENDAYDGKILEAVIEERMQEIDAYSNEIQQQLLKERQMVIIPQCSIPLLV